MWWRAHRRAILAYQRRRVWKGDLRASAACAHGPPCGGQDRPQARDWLLDHGTRPSSPVRGQRSIRRKENRRRLSSSPCLRPAQPRPAAGTRSTCAATRMWGSNQLADGD